MNCILKRSLTIHSVKKKIVVFGTTKLFDNNFYSAPDRQREGFFFSHLIATHEFFFKSSPHNGRVEKQKRMHRHLQEKKKKKRKSKSKNFHDNIRDNNF